MAIISKVRRTFHAKRKLIYSWTAKYLSGHQSGSSVLGTIVMRNNGDKVAKVDLRPKFLVDINFTVPSSTDPLFAKWDMYFNLILGALQSETYVQTTAVSAVASASTNRACILESYLNRPLFFTIPPRSSVTITVNCAHIVPPMYAHSGAVTPVLLTTGPWYDTSNIIMILEGIADESVVVVSALPNEA